MHAYGHQWSCQLVYNPRLRAGLGLSEGEGTERLWSRLRKLIGLTRSSAVCFPFIRCFSKLNEISREHEDSGLLTGRPVP